MRVRLLTALSLAALAMTPAPAAADDALTLAAPAASVERPATILLDRAQTNGRNGTLALVLSNDSDARRSLTVRFLPQAGGPGYTVAGTAMSRRAVTLGAAGAPSALGARTTAQLSLRFRLVDGQPLSVASGQIVVTAAASGGAGAPPPASLVVPVRAQPAAASDIASASGTASLQTTQWFPGLAPRGGETRVMLIGTRASTVYRDPDQLDGTAILRDGGGDEAVVGWHVQPASRPADRYVAIVVRGNPAPGRYSGTLPLGAAAADPHVSVTLTARLAPWLAVAAILLGAFVSLSLTLLGPLRRRKQLLRAEVLDVLAAYRAMRERYPQSAGYNLDDAIGDDDEPWKDKTWMAMPRLRGVAGLFSSIHWARNQGDLDDDADWATDLAARVARFLRVEEQAQLLLQAYERAVPQRQAYRFDTTGTAKDSLLLLYEARDDEPRTDGDAESLRHRLKRQAEWHRGVADAWTAFVALDAAKPGDPLLPSLRQQLDALVDATPAAKRTQEEHDELLVKLDALREALAEHGAEGTEATGLALMVEARPAQLASAIVVPAPENRAGVPSAARTHERGRAVRPMNGLTIDAWLLTLATVLATAVAYLPTVYSDTWGSLTDLLTAFAAGFGGRVILDWALLPVAQSLRVRPTSRGPDGGQGGGGAPSTNGTAQPAVLPPAVLPQGVAAGDGHGG